MVFNFIKKRLQHKCFLVNITNFLRTVCLWNTPGGCFWFLYRNMKVNAFFINISKSTFIITKKLQQYISTISTIYINDINNIFQGRIQRSWKGGALYVGQHGWPAKRQKEKKNEITLETTSFWQNISVNIFKFSPFFFKKNLINFSKFTNVLIRKEKKILTQ